MKNETKNVHIRLGSFSINLENVKSISISNDGKMILVVSGDDTKYETAVQNVIIVSKKQGDDELRLEGV